MFSKSMRRTLELLSIFGAVPFQWDKDKLVLRMRYSFILITLTLCLIFEIVFFTSPHLNKISRSLKIVIHLLSSLMATVNTVIFVSKKDHLERSVRSLAKIHSALRDEPVRAGAVFQIVLAALTLVTLTSMMWLLQSDSIVIIIYYCCTWGGFMLFRVTLSMIFCFFLKIPGDCFATLTFLLGGSPKRQISIDKLLKVYNKLVDDCTELNGSFEVQLLLSLAYSLCQIILNLYSLNKSNFYITTSSLSSISMSVIQIWYLFSNAESVMSKAKRFNAVLSNIALHNVNGQYEKNFHIPMHFIVGKKLKLQTYGGLTLNYRLLLSLTASCITYFVILHQLR